MSGFIDIYYRGQETQSCCFFWNTNCKIACVKYWQSFIEVKFLAFQ